MQVRITARKVYGETKFYPANLQAECLATVAGTKTLTLHALRAASRMGCDVLVDGDATLADILGTRRIPTTQAAE